MNTIKEFYDQNPFPGEYTWAQLMDVSYPPTNRYLRVIDKHLSHHQTVLDVGCGTGLITNLFATRYQSRFVGVDFSRGIDIAEQFARINRIDNVEYHKEDFYHFYPRDQFDVVIAQSFLTHAIDPLTALNKLKMHTKTGGTLIFSVYNPAGQFLKKICNFNYNNTRLELDQKHNPLDNVYSDENVRFNFNDWELQEVMPSINNRLVRLSAFLNSQNGGLTVYVYRNN